MWCKLHKDAPSLPSIGLDAEKNIIFAEKLGDGKRKWPLFFYAIYGSFTMENLTSCIKFGWYLNDFFLNSDERDADVVNNTWTAPWNGDMGERPSSWCR